MTAVVGKVYEDVAGRKLIVDEVNMADNYGREVVGRLSTRGEGVSPYSCTLLAFQRVWLNRARHWHPRDSRGFW